MIARLQGTVDSYGGDWVILNVRDIGYLVYCSGRTVARLPAPGTTVALHVETYVRTDAITLYGFLDHAERDWFRLLTTVQGVGARMALQLLSVLTPEELAQAVATQDKVAMTRAAGVGPRMATRLLNELQDKVPHRTLVTITDTGTDSGRLPVLPRSTVAVDAVAALVNLGYGRMDALSMVAQAEARITREMPQVEYNLSSLLRIALQSCVVCKDEE
ncbi:Holliday junction DNA helicase RuvA [invertebrate metagenome]|uniref:Holliday junction DNA helicase RuvA n=1 Tax=invertebrate metagenome TaxID=1711999 RepID=A0A484H616_9ZZZZ